jgi:hypothetical protein
VAGLKTEGSHGLVCVSKAFLSFDSNERVVPVAQIGKAPDLDNSTWTVGPTGIVAIDASNHFWIGLPATS